ncbi:MAG: IS1595 family transposase [Phenylobacterium sp.]|uniref:IS1595 family transposase n=1 Tax=Phenylobacterium sp. TaxID=1871053 RepID=UPI002A360D9D|nr:IS1595 family transposase [Phenylobacterium sp.]MDX9998602.1 IS1595 family transposase [Phenylobacterium sp.]
MNLTDPIFTDETKAREHLERTRWPHGPVCPHCGVVDQATKLEGEKHRKGLYQCNACREQFTVTVGTVFEKSKVPLNKWLLATYLLSASKKGMSAHQLHRTLGVTYKTAWFMAHRIREAMIPEDNGPFGKGGATVEVDETFLGTDPDAPKPRPGKSRGVKQMMKVVSLVERETGRARSFVADEYSIQGIIPIVERNLHAEAKLMTDESRLYTAMGASVASHNTVNHSAKEYVSRENRLIHTNTIEGFFGVFKRGMRGVYQHCGKQHLHRYLREFDFRYSMRSALGVDDATRADEALRGIGGKRLTYRRIGEAANA